MSETQNNEGVFTSTAAHLSSFPNLLEAKAVKQKNGKDSGEPKFSLNIEMVTAAPDLAAAKALAAKVARAKWPTRPLSELSFPFTDGEKLANKAKEAGKEREWSRGKVVLTARSKYEPRLSVIENGRVRDFEGDGRKLAGSKFFTGAEVLFQVNFVAYDGVGQNPDGVTAYLNMVCATGKGTKLAGGGASAAEVFKGYVGTTSNEDPTAGSLDDEIPF